MTGDAREATVELGELISALYEACVEMYGDAEVASVVTADLVNRYLASRNGRSDVDSYVN